MTAAQGTPLVSVILPTHNRANLLRRAIQSVLGQSFTDLELIVIDDASTDDTPAVVRSFADARIRYLRQEPNRRAAAARNLGFEQARGHLLAYQDDDDVWLPHKLERQLATLDTLPADVGLIISSHIRLYPDHARYIGGAHFADEMDYGRGGPKNADYSLIATPGWLLRREVLEKTGGFDERLRSFDDWELGLRITDHCRVHHLDEPLFIQDRAQGSGMVFDEVARYADMLLIEAEHGWRWKHDAAIRSLNAFQLGLTACLYADASEGQRWMSRAVRARWSNPRALGGWAASRLGRPGVLAALRVLRLLRWLSGRRSNYPRMETNGQFERRGGSGRRGEAPATE